MVQTANIPNKFVCRSLRFKRSTDDFLVHLQYSLQTCSTLMRHPCLNIFRGRTHGCRLSWLRGSRRESKLVRDDPRSCSIQLHPRSCTDPDQVPGHFYIAAQTPRLCRRNRTNGMPADSALFTETMPGFCQSSQSRVGRRKLSTVVCDLMRSIYVMRANYLLHGVLGLSAGHGLERRKALASAGSCWLILR